MWLTPDESEALCLSLRVATRSVAFSLPFAVWIAWLLTRTRFVGRAVLDALVHLPLVLPPVVVGYLLLLLFDLLLREAPPLRQIKRHKGDRDGG